MTRRGTGTSSGRRGSLTEARELVALASSLSEAGDSLSVEAVAARLGVDESRARKLVELLASSQTADGTMLPLVREVGGELTLLLDGGVRGRRLRLSRAETTALLAALDRMGVAGDDPLRERLASSLSEAALSEGSVRKTLGEMSSGTDALPVCSRALLEGAELGFFYQGARGGRTGRRVRPERVFHEGGHWYLEAFDLVRQGRRTFRLDRMSEVAENPREAEALAPGHPAREARTVTLLFSDSHYLDLLPWHDLSVEKRDGDGPVRATTPYYGGLWLPRMIAACGGAVTTDDRELSSLVRSYALSQLRGR